MATRNCRASRIELRRIRGREIAYLLQNPMSAFNPMFTVLKHICDSILIHEKVKKKEAIRRAINLLGRTGFAEPETARNVPFRRESYVGRNAPCPFL